WSSTMRERAGSSRGRRWPDARRGTPWLSVRSPMPERCLNHNRGVAVLASGGIDSAILCVDLLEEFNRVHPLYVRFGLRWEDFEVTGLKRFLDAVARPG